MNLRELNLRISYRNKGNVNMVDSFLLPCLQCAKIYKRSVGFFSSSVFELLSVGLENFINRDGKIQIICSPELSQKDIDAIKMGYKLKEEIQKEKFEEDLNECLCQLQNEELKIFVKLISENRLNIVIVDVDNDIGIYHDKIGYIEDYDGNSVLFVGSPNESKNAYINNYEKIRVSMSWKSGDIERIEDEIEEFDSIWNGTNNYINQYDVSEIVSKKIKGILKVKDDENNAEVEKEPVKLRGYQKQAIDAWIANNYHGFYVMATGTGKTWTAIYSAMKITKDKPIMLVICAPYKHLVKQWYEDVNKVFVDNTIIMVSSENTDWENELKDAILESKYSNPRTTIVISTIVSFGLDRFKKTMSKCTLEKMLIVDEAHRFKNRDSSLQNEYKYMLGLSATPASRKNDENAEQLLAFFGGRVFNLPIEYAIEKGYLVHYNYHPIFVNATKEESEEFDRISRQMAGCFKNGRCIDLEKLGKLKRNRLRVISMAQEKNDRLDWIFSQMKEEDHFIVYCGDGRLNSESTGDQLRHIEYVSGKLREKGFKVGQFTASEKMKERMELIDMFNKGTIDSLVAIRCLDEGVNIPSIKGALILSSNDDYREFVQRRGRILRTYTNEYSGKEKGRANIYDVVVLPDYFSSNFAKIELRRVYEYMRLADNIDSIQNDFENMCAEYGINIEELMEMEDVEVDLDE